MISIRSSKNPLSAKYPALASFCLSFALESLVVNLSDAHIRGKDSAWEAIVSLR